VPPIFRFVPTCARESTQRHVGKQQALREMSQNTRRKWNQAPVTPSGESESVEVPNNQASAEADALAEINQCGAAATEHEESSHHDGAEAAPAVAEEVIASTDEQSVASLPVESHATAETESISAGEMPADLTEELPTEGRRIITIERRASILRRRVFVARSLLVVAAEHQAKVAASNGHPWSVGQAHIDSPKSSKYGISLADGLQALGIERLQRGDWVQIEIGRGATCYRVAGRASRKVAAYFAKTDLAEAGIMVHTPFHYVVLRVVSPSGVEGGQP
jgi:hypothetical protein